MLWRFAICLWVSSLAVGCQQLPIHDQQPPNLVKASSGSEQDSFLRFATYNAHLLPAAARPIAGHRGHSSYRAGQIFTHLADCDLIGFCEVFAKPQREELITSVKSNGGQPVYFAVGPKRALTKGANSGLLLVSRLPIEDQNTLAFSSSSRMWRDGWKADGLATKGVLHARLNCGQQNFDCFLTHLDSLLPSVREQQLAELCQFIVNFSSPDSAVVVMGDFNIAGPRHGSGEFGTTEYDQMITTLSNSTNRTLFDVGMDAEQGTADALHPETASRIDYVLVMPPTSIADLESDANSTGSVLHRWVEHRHMLDSNVKEGSLSDHSAVVVDLSLVN